MLFTHKSFGIRNANPQNLKNVIRTFRLLISNCRTIRDYIPMFSALIHTFYVSIGTVYLLQ